MLEPTFEDRKQAKTPNIKMNTPKLVKYRSKGKAVYRYD
jgi:hypothetical protein